MFSKWLIGLFMVLGLGGVWIVFNPSYQKSFEAKVWYAMGKYEEAYSYSKEAFEMDGYNRMASTIMAQSQTALKFVRYNKDADTYKRAIHTIADQPNISGSDRAKIRMMTSIMVDSYKKIAPTVVTDAALVEEAQNNYKQFKKLHDELAPSR